MDRLSKFAMIVCLSVDCGNAAAMEIFMSKQTMAKLAALKEGEQRKIDGFPISAAGKATIRLRPAKIYADDARIFVMTDKGPQELPRSKRIFLRGYADDGSASVAMSLNPDNTFAEGGGSGPDGSFTLRDNGHGTLSAVALESSVPTATKLNFQCGNEFATLDFGPRSLGRSLGISALTPQATEAGSKLSLAIVAIDTDTLFMSKLFANNTVTATNWIGSMFNAMNTMYERDLSVALVQGTTFLRTTTDPYGAASDVPANVNDLDIFGSYWKANESAVPRSFATLLSGRGPCSGGMCNASGIAWIDEYCQKGFSSSSGTVGSYNVVQVFSSLSVDPNGAIAARLTGHELGHNFGAFHTHCTDASSGAAPTGVNTIDKCYSGEVDNSTACYSGATSCPTTGPGAPAGSIMSYCNIKGCPAAGSQNVLQFHPTQVAVLDGYIAAESSCLNAVDDIFFNGFE